MPGRIGKTCGTKSLGAQPTRVADATRSRLRIRRIARQRKCEIDAESSARLDDVDLRQAHERRAYLDRFAFDAGACCKRGEALKRGEILRTAIGIARIVDGVGADVDRLRVEHFRPA